MQADILILDHYPAGFHLIADKKILREIGRRCSQVLPQLIFRRVAGKGNAVSGTDIDAGVTFDAEVAGKHSLHIAVETATGLFIGLFGIKTGFDFYHHRSE